MQSCLGSGCPSTRDTLAELSFPDSAIAMESAMLGDHAYMSTMISRFLPGNSPSICIE
jgi:hypothetical protein